MLRSIIVLPALLISQAAHAQTTCAEARGGDVRQVQPRIIAIPFTREGDDLRTVLEANLNGRVAVAKVQQALDQRGFASIDFLGALRAVERAGGIQTLSQTDLKSAIVEQARADIYIEIETEIETSAGGLNSAVIIMRGYLTANGLSLGNRVGRSPRNRAEPSRLIERAVDDESEPLLAMMQEKFSDFTVNGVPIGVNISAAVGAAHEPGTRVGTATVADLVEDWMAQHAWKNQYTISSVTDKRLTFDEVRIPMRDPETCRNFTPTQFGRDLRRFLQDRGVPSTLTVSHGNIFVELQ